MVNFVCTPRSSRITITIAMETVPYSHSVTEFIFGTNYLHFSRVPINDMTPMKNCLGGCKVGKISYWCTMHRLVICMEILS